MSPRSIFCLAAASVLVATVPLRACASEPVLTIEKDSYTLTEPANIVVTGLEPGQTITLTASRRSDYDPAQLIRSITDWQADASGTFSTASATPLDVDWTEPDPFAPYWMMRRVDGEDGETPFDYGATEVRIAIDLDQDGAPDLTDSFTLQTGAENTVSEMLGDDFPGAFITRPAGSEGTQLPLIVTVGGSEGGDSFARYSGPRLAQEGYAVLGLPYHSPAYFGGQAQFPDLPSAFANLPVDYIEEAVTSLSARDGINTRHIGLYGASKGAELVLLSSAYAEGTYETSICAVAAIVPSDVVWEGWGAGTTSGETSGFSLKGEPLPFVPYKGMDETIAKVSRGESADFVVPHNDGRAAASPETIAAARIPVEKIEAGLFLVGGDKDTTWNSGQMTRNIADSYNNDDRTARVILSEEAGHGLSGSPYRPTSYEEARVRQKAWPALLAFFDDTLKSSSACN